MKEPNDYATVPRYSTEADAAECYALALARSKERLQNGTATAQEITFWLQEGSTKKQLEREKLQQDIQVGKAKVKNFESAEKYDLEFQNVMDALKRYGGHNFT